MLHSLKRGTLLFVALLLAGAGAAQDGVRIITTGTTDARTPIAVPDFAAMDPSLAPIARELAEVVAFDLEFSGLFKILPRDQFPQGFTGFSTEVSNINLDAWRATKAENLVYGNVNMEGGQLVGRFRLFDLLSKDQVVGQELRVDRAFPRLAAHRFSEEILRHLYGTQGIGTSEIVFSVGPQGSKEIYVADYDGANAKQVTQHGSVSIKPKISPDGNKIAYLSYKDRYPFLYVYDRRSGQSIQLSKEVGLNMAPAWSPDGSELAMALSKDGNTEIYLRNADGSNPRRLTNNREGDTSPVFSPDGSRIAFVSDRGGSPQIFVMGRDGGNATRLSFQGGNAFDPAWSPDGTQIAYVAERSGEGLEIYIMNADGSNPRRMTDSQGTNESPSWSADQRHLIFMSNRAGTTQIWALNVESGDAKAIPRLAGMRCEGPSWGPRRR